MKEIKIFARAGQGAITTAAILGEAFFYEGKYAYAFPHFGAARMGAPMNAFLRFDQRPIRKRCQVYRPDYSIVVDPTLLGEGEDFKNLPEGAKVIVAVREETVMPAISGAKVFTLPAEKIAQDIIGKPFANTVLLGAFAKATGEVSLDAVIKSVSQRFSNKPAVLEKNIQAVKKGFESV